jgi:hypothetical protein
VRTHPATFERTGAARRVRINLQPYHGFELAQAAQNQALKLTAKATAQLITGWALFRFARY